MSITDPGDLLRRPIRGSYTPIILDALTMSFVHCRKSTTKQRPRSYRVMLHNDDFNRREYVVKVLLKVLDNFTMEDAINCMQV